MKFIFYFFMGLLFFSCEDPLPEELDIGESIPLTTPLFTTTLFDKSTITLSWEGNDFTLAFSYKLEPLSYLDTVQTYNNWSEWDSLETVTFNYLDDGFYNFHIKSRFTIDNEEAPIIIPIEVDAILGPALRVYPIYQTVKTGSACDVYIYVEDPEALAGMALNISYNSSLLNYGSHVLGPSLLNTPISFDEINSTDGIVDIIAVADDFGVINNTEFLIKLTLEAKNIALKDTIFINQNSLLHNAGNDASESPDRYYGIIEVVQ